MFIYLLHVIAKLSLFELPTVLFKKNDLSYILKIHSCSLFETYSGS